MGKNEQEFLQACRLRTNHFGLKIGVSCEGNRIGVPLSQGYHSMHMDSQEMIIQANIRINGKKMGKVLVLLRVD